MSAEVLDLAGAGWRVFPCRPDKSPAVASWPKDATSNTYQVQRWVEAGHRHWAIALPDDVVVVDLDRRPGGPDGFASIKAQDLELPATRRASTPGSGLHLYYRATGARCRNALLPGLDVKAAGGYVLCPPSPGRKWLAPLRRESIAPAPTWLLEALQRPDTGQARPASEWREIAAQGAENGSRNNTAAALAGHLLRKYVDPFVALELLRCWNAQRCRPPLPEQELERTLDSIARRELERRARNG